MTKRIGTLALIASLATPCWAADRPAPHRKGGAKSYAVYGEYARDANKLMKGMNNRRIFNVVEAQEGDDIKLNADGSITLAPGTYRINGFSLVTMQTTFAPPEAKNNTNYPGYAVVYPKAYESSSDLLKHLVAYGSPQPALDGVPSFFDLIYTAEEKTDLCVGHQSGKDLHDEVYLSVYEVDGIKSDTHLFARVAITKM